MKTVTTMRTATQIASVVPTYLVAAAETARRLGPGSAVTVVAPRRAGLVQQARTAAQDHGVQVRIIQIKALTVRLRFSALEEPAPLATAARPGAAGKLRTRIGRELAAGWRRFLRLVRRPDEPPELRLAHWD
jgi:hypothetical protein